MSIEELFALLKEQGHTGPVTIQVAQGTPTHAEIRREPQRIVLDTRTKKRLRLTA